MLFSLRKKSQNYFIDQGATFEKSFQVENTSSNPVDLSSGVVIGKLIKNLRYANTVETFTTHISGSTVTFSLNADETSVLKEGKYYYDLFFVHSDGETKELILEGMVTVNPSAYGVASGAPDTADNIASTTLVTLQDVNISGLRNNAVMFYNANDQKFYFSTLIDQPEIEVNAGNF